MPEPSSSTRLKFFFLCVNIFYFPLDYKALDNSEQVTNDFVAAVASFTEELSKYLVTALGRSITW